MSPPGTTATVEAPTSPQPCTAENGGPRNAQQILAAARILHGRGWSERATECLLDVLAAKGVRDLARSVTRMNPARDAELRRRYDDEARQHRPGRRGDLIQLRSAPHWPWRVAT